MRNRLRFAVPLTLLAVSLAAQQKHAASGMLLKIDAPHRTITVSCREIPGYMPAMEMPFFISDTKELNGLRPGIALDFDLIDRNGKPYAENIRAHPFLSLELDPTTAQRLKGVETALALKDPAVPVGKPVPDFLLLDQQNNPVQLSQFTGKVVAITFMYTRCPFPNYCARLSGNFERLQKRFRPQMGRELILLNIVIDTAHDQKLALADYARQYHADAAGWHFLTGPDEQVRKICRYFDMNYYPDEGLYFHSFHTAIIGRDSKLVANLEGNEFTAQQLGDLVESVLRQSK